MKFIDTSFYLSATVESDSNNPKAKKIEEKIKNDEVCTSEDVLKEILTLISQRQGKEASIAFYNKLVIEAIIIPITSDIFVKALEIFLSPKLNKDISLIDCVTAAICKDKGIKKIVAFDSHFKKLGLEVIQ